MTVYIVQVEEVVGRNPRPSQHGPRSRDSHARGMSSGRLQPMTRRVVQDEQAVEEERAMDVVSSHTLAGVEKLSL
jgi:hypothetical protein